MNNLDLTERRMMSSLQLRKEADFGGRCDVERRRLRRLRLEYKCLRVRRLTFLSGPPVAGRVPSPLYSGLAAHRTVVLIIDLLS